MLYMLTHTHTYICMHILSRKLVEKGLQRVIRFGTKHTYGKYRTDSRLGPSQWEAAFQSNTVSHWLGASPKSVLWIYTPGWRIAASIKAIITMVVGDGMNAIHCKDIYIIPVTAIPRRYILWIKCMRSNHICWEFPIQLINVTILQWQYMSVMALPAIRFFLPKACSVYYKEI